MKGIKFNTPPVILAVNNLNKSYVDAVNPYPAVADFCLEVYQGEILALLGPSGCGKTTLLRLIAGFEVPQKGNVVIQNCEVVGEGIWVPPEKRRLGFVFQDYALFPHLNVLQNVAFGLKNMSRKKRLERAKEIINLVGLTIFSKRYPHQLSGGQQQRVALARALAPAPKVILLDEPFSNLDAALRSSTRQEIKKILKSTETTVVLVTHDQEEAMTFADRLAVMRLGKLEQIGTPEEVYAKPCTAFVASFLGTTNLMHAVVEGDFASTTIGKIPLITKVNTTKTNILLSIRPEDLGFSKLPDNNLPDNNLLDHNLLNHNLQGVPVKITNREFKGHDLTFICETTKGEKFTVQTTPECFLQIGDNSKLIIKGTATPLVSNA